MYTLYFLPAIFIVGCYVMVNNVNAHGAMVMPISWFDKKQWLHTDDGVKYEYIGMKSGMHCYAGCDIPPADICPGRPEHCENNPNPGCACMWFNNNTFIEKPTLFDSKLRTYAHEEDPSYNLHSPWRAPGIAPINSPCGVAGGNINGCGDGPCTGGGYARGPKAENFHFKHNIAVTNWTRGAIVEAAWGITANHGGGYSYRLCKIPKEGVQALTEECFQQTPLKFFGSKQWVQYGEDASTRKEFIAVRTDIGTFPKGSQWTKNPIPACNGEGGGFFSPTGNCPNGTQFPPNGEDLFGFGINQWYTVKPFKFVIIDKLIIPKSLEPGNYI